MTILPVLLLAGLAAIVRCLACTTRKLGPACLAVGAVFVARVDLLWLLHCETVLLDLEIFVEFITNVTLVGWVCPLSAHARSEVRLGLLFAFGNM